MNESLNLFELIECTRLRINSESKVNLEPYEFKITTKNFNNNPYQRLNFELLIFNQCVGTSYFDKNISTINSIIDMFILEIKDNFDCVLDCLIWAKISTLQYTMNSDIEKLKKILQNQYPNADINTQIEEKNEKYKNGFPRLYLDVMVIENKVTIKRFYQELGFYGRGLFQSEIFNDIKKSNT